MKKLNTFVLPVAFALALTACSSKSSTPGTEPAAAAQTSASQAVTENPEQKEPAGTDAAVLQGTGETLTIYSNSVSDGRGDWLVKRAAEDGFKLQYIDAGAAEVQSRLIAEKNAPVADITFGLNAIIWESLIAGDILLPYVPAWADEVSAGLNSEEGYYHAIVKQAILLVYDKNQVDEAAAPKDWVELWSDEKYWNTYEFQRSLSGGTVRNVLAGIFSRYADPNGELGISEDGWNQIAAYYEHGVGSETNVDVYAQIVNPDSMVVAGQMWSSGIETRDEQYGTDTGIVVPAVGVPYAVEGVAIVKGTKHEAEAQRFIDWFGSAQIQGEWAEQFSTLPANEYAIDKANEFNQYIATIPAQDIDWALVAENIDAWCEKIELTYMR